MGLPGQAGSQDPWTTGRRIAKTAGAYPSSGPAPTTTLPGIGTCASPPGTGAPVPESMIPGWSTDAWFEAARVSGTTNYAAWV